MRQHKQKFAKLEEQKETTNLKEQSATKKLLGVTLSKVDMDEIAKGLERTYDADALANYMEAMEAKALQETKVIGVGGEQFQVGSNRTGKKTSFKKSAKSTLKSRATAFAVQTAVPNVFESQASARAFPRISKK